MADQYPLGWIDFDKRTDEQNLIHAAATAQMPTFGLVGEGKPEVGFKILLTNFWSAPKVVQALGYAFPGVHQITGSCVGAGGGNGVLTLNAIEVARNNEAEKIILPFWLYNYGRSRELAGMRGRGEGSLGSTFAKSLTMDGCLDGRLQEFNLPQPNNNDQLVWGSDVELQWSDGRKAPQAVRDHAKQQLVKSTAELGTGEQVRDAIINGYPVLRAFQTYCNPGSASVRNGALIGSYNGRGGHQESWLGYWNHPQEGELIWEQNQWGKKAYGTDPGGGPAGGCWIRLADVDRQCRGQYAEIYALSQFEGYPAQPDVFDWSKQSLWS